jgi:hypothetical protein
MFFKKCERKDLLDKVAELNDKISYLRREEAETQSQHDRERAISDAAYELKIKLQAEDITRAKEVLQSKIELETAKAVNEKTKKIAALELENGVLKGENSMLKKAFENLGFDVKDMKGILEKLVDGIVSKNQVHIVK